MDWSRDLDLMNDVLVVQGSWRSVSDGAPLNCSLYEEMKPKCVSILYTLLAGEDLLTFLTIALIDEVW